jgi:katanin p60 ATPase-containing subunit A1
MSTDVLGVRSSSKAREAEEKRLQERRRSTLVLILRHLCDSGYIEAYERLSKEANLDLSKVSS